MDKPATLRVTDGGVLRSALGAAGVGMALLAVVLVVVLVTTEASVTDLMLPAGALSTFWVAWLAVGLLRSAMIRRADRRGIGRLFDGESWARMQFDADEWRTVAEERYREQRGDTAFGIAFAGAIGLVLGAIATLVGWLATDDRAVSITLTLAGVAVVALFVTVASFQPWSQRRTLDR